MALISCPECQSEVSDAAWDCGQCGRQLRKPKRGFFGKIIKWSFILFNVLMAYWLFAGVGAATDGMTEMSEAQKAGTAVGAGLGAMLIVSIWAIGDIILGLFVLFTRPQKK